MDGKGYGFGLGGVPRQGASPLGTGNGTFGFPNGGGGGIVANSMGSGGSYGSTGGGSVSGLIYGASDFWEKLYLGSQGGSGWQCGYDCYYTSGGVGGGAIYINAATIRNAGRISADGASADTGGSGGTIVMIADSIINSASGLIYARGGSGSAAGGFGRIGMSYTDSLANTGLVSPASVTLPPGLPGAPYQITAIAGDGEVQLNWKAPPPSALRAITDYLIEYSIDFGATWTTVSDGINSAVSSVITGLQNGKFHRFKITAKNQNGNSITSELNGQALPRTAIAVGGVLDGSEPARAAPNAKYIKELIPDAPDGVYWIDLPQSGPTQVYCIMNSSIDGGGWMLAMKATRGTTFNYNSTYWTQPNLLNEMNPSRTDGDAKYAVMNEFPGLDIMALWPDLGAGGDINPAYSSWVWLEKNIIAGRSLISFFASQPQTQLARTKGAQWAGKFSSQGGYGFYGFNYTTGSGWAGADVRVRWGFGWNNENDQNTNDVTGGIGMGKNNWSAGDSISCCQDTTGFNRSARVEIYVK
jgi:hypothetical protein